MSKLNESFPVLNINVLMERIDHDSKLACQLLGLFLKESSTVIASLSAEQLKLAATDELIYRVHTLRGMCMEVGGEHLANIALDFELQLKESETIPDGSWPKKLQDAYCALELAIQEYIES